MTKSKKKPTTRRKTAKTTARRPARKPAARRVRAVSVDTPPRPDEREAAVLTDGSVVEATSIEPEPQPPTEADFTLPLASPEIEFATRTVSAAARPFPPTRRVIFFDVENTSRAEHIARVIDHLAVDRIGQHTEFVAVGNWKVIGPDTARLLSQHGAQLVHSAPASGVRDWSDLRIAVSAGVWLAGARPGDVVEIVSNDRAFDAVGDVAAGLGIAFRRLVYQALAAVGEARAAAAPVDADGRPRRGRRGRRRGRRDDGPRHARPVHAAPPVVAAADGVEPEAAAVAEAHREPRREPPHEPPREAPREVHRDRHREAQREPDREHHREPHREARREPRREPHREAEVAGEQHTAPHDEIVSLIRELIERSPAHRVSLDALANALKARGFRRTPGSPRLITRLRRIKEVHVSQSGVITLTEQEGAPEAPPAVAEGEAVPPAPAPVLPGDAEPEAPPARPAIHDVEEEDEDRQPDVTPTGEPIGGAPPQRGDARRRGGPGRHRRMPGDRPRGPGDRVRAPADRARATGVPRRHTPRYPLGGLG